MIPEINSEVFSILSLQAHYCPIESNKEFAEQLDIFLKTRLNSMLKVSNLSLNFAKIILNYYTLFNGSTIY